MKKIWLSILMSALVACSDESAFVGLESNPVTLRTVIMPVFVKWFGELKLLAHLLKPLPY